jgi:hypothetical protein
VTEAEAVGKTIDADSDGDAEALKEAVAETDEAKDAD